MPTSDFRFSLTALESSRELAEGILALASTQSLPDTDAAKALLAKAQEAQRYYEESKRDVDAYAEEISKARLGCNDELEIDDNPLLSVGDDGLWVSAWIYVKKCEAEDAGDGE